VLLYLMLVGFWAVVAARTVTGDPHRTNLATLRAPRIRPRLALPLTVTSVAAARTVEFGRRSRRIPRIAGSGAFPPSVPSR